MLYLQNEQILQNVSVKMLTLRIGLLKILFIIMIAKITTLKSLNCNFSSKLKLEHCNDLPFSPPNAMFANATLIVRPHQLLAPNNVQFTKCYSLLLSLPLSKDYFHSLQNHTSRKALSIICSH